MTHHLTRVDPRLVVLREGPKAVRQRWHLFKWGEVLHHAEDFTVDEDFAREMLASFAAVTEGSIYRPPILEEHEAEGRGYGLVSEMGTDEEGIWADVDLPEVVAAEIDAGLRIYISPSFFPEWVHPHTGEELKFVLREVSLVGVPHLKNLRPLGSHYSLSESGWATTTQEAALADTENTETPETALADEPTDAPDIDMAEAITALGEAIASLSERVGAIESAMQPEEEPEEEPTENGESIALKRVAELERKLAVADAKTTVLAVLPTALAEEVDDLAHAIVTDKARGTRLLSLAERAYKAESKPGKVTVQEPQGKPGTAPAGPISFGEAFDAIAEEVGSYDSRSVMPLMEKRHPNLCGGVLLEG